ncbi:metallophosphoesterase [Parvibaculum lavamentivorans DS-1]|uniref:Metallophosphoesterase n=1 Tax=Parvibaculum lavamentivorans (strain DS-1 / DSM 13023 / NCIMB 13966) TaxID=402881 RepID=A7HUD4_PARL1|nr:metallophosphoesterase family protein [Parvibaculum lavamentivorans]ABS63517.1 metallophosphoesterase [Parvibaculum lavamentivorans DS-1]
MVVFNGLVSRLRGALGSGGSPAQAPENTRLYAIGDIHGRADLLTQLLERIAEDARRQPFDRNILIFLGDYVDRGLQSRQVLDRLTDGLIPGFEPVFLKGNHEQALLQFLSDAAFGRTWKYYGGLETLHSYGIKELTLSDDPRDFEQAREHFSEVLPESHRRFLTDLALSAEFGDYFFTHAGVRPGVALHRQIEEDLLWIREDFLESGSHFGKVVVHGHTPREEVVFRANRIGVDTGAYMTGVLTALVLEGASRRLLQTGEAMSFAAAS